MEPNAVSFSSRSLIGTYFGTHFINRYSIAHGQAQFLICLIKQKNKHQVFNAYNRAHSAKKIRLWFCCTRRNRKVRKHLSNIESGSSLNYYIIFSISLIGVICMPKPKFLADFVSAGSNRLYWSRIHLYRD